MIGVAVVGYGYWGPNLVRNFNDVEGCRLVAVCDRDPARLKGLDKRYPHAKLTQNYDDLLQDNEIDAIVIATPTATHFPLALKALQSGRHAFVEKPLASTSPEVMQLIEEAEKRELVLQVDHTFIYTGAVRRIKEIIESGKLGNVLYYDSTRVNLGLFQKDVNVLWDLAVHDLAIMDFLLPDHTPAVVSATGIAHVPGHQENLAYITLLFQDNLIAHIHANWLAPAKIRRTIIGGEQQMIVYDDLDPSERVKVYDKGVTLGVDEKEMQISYRSGDVWSPRLESEEALTVEARHFVDCVLNKQKPMTDGYAGLRVVKIIEAADLSMKSHGKPIGYE